MLNWKALEYLLAQLEGAPNLYESLVSMATDEELDYRPDPERFTIREAISHVADWEPIFAERLEIILTVENGTLQGYDESEIARTGKYGERSVPEQIRLIAERRRKLVARIKGLSPEDWDRSAEHTEIGHVVTTDLVVLIAAHDAYHLRQIAEWRRLYELQ